MKQYYLQYIKPLLNNRSSEKNNGYIFYRKECNKILFKRLKEKGFFDFHVTNKSQTIVSEHQIVLFFDYGYKALNNGFVAKQGELEIHHINGITDDNRAANLVYLSSSDHHFVSAVSDTPFLTFEFTQMSTPFNRQGRSIYNNQHFIKNVLSVTLNSMKYKIKINFDNISSFVEKYLPSWIKKFSKNLVEYHLLFNSWNVSFLT